MQKTLTIRKITQTALIVAIVLVLRNFSYMFYFGGGAGMRVGISGFFSVLPALLFGPVYGGLASGMIDILAYFIKPEGGYLPFLTVTAILGGILTGLLWKYAKNISTSLFKKIFGIVFAVIGMIGAINWLIISFIPSSEYASLLLSFEKKISFLTAWPLAAGILAFLIFILDAFLRKKDGQPDDFIKLFTVLFIANIIVTTLNTFILMIFIPALGNLAFLVFYIPRFIEECILTILQSYVVSYFLRIYNRIYKNKA